MSRVTAIKEHDFEPVPGLPAPLPEGESILWQGSPHWLPVARRAMHIRLCAVYFGLLIAWGIVGGIGDGTAVLGLAVSSARLAALGGAAIALLCGFAWLVARTTIYTVTTRRVVMRFGIALPIIIQIAYPMIDAASVSAGSDGDGDIALTLRQGHKIAYLVLWPHARPWKLAKTEPSLRGIKHVAGVAQILGRALAASAAQAAVPVSIPVASQGVSGAHVPAAA
jgi:hypothetical protein